MEAEEKARLKAIDAASELDDNQTFNFIYKIVTGQMKYKSIEEKKHGVSKKRIKLCLDCLGYVYEGKTGEIEHKPLGLTDSVKSLALTRSIWKVVRPFADPVHTPCELEDAITSVILGWMRLEETRDCCGVSLRHLKHKLTQLRDSFLPLKVNDMQELRDLYSRDSSLVTQRIQELVYDLPNRGAKPLLSQVCIDIQVAKADFGGKCGDGSTNRIFQMEISDLIKAEGTALLEIADTEEERKAAKRMIDAVVSPKTILAYKRSCTLADKGASMSKASVVNIKRLVQYTLI